MKDCIIVLAFIVKKKYVGLIERHRLVPDT